MEKVELAALPRAEMGKGVTGRMRREGYIPAVLYGPGVKESLHLKFNARDIDKAIHTHSGANVLVELSMEGDKKPRTVMFKAFQRHPVSEAIEHIDLMTVMMDKEITVEVPLQLVGKSEGVTLGGILQQEARTLKIECLPTAIPDSIEVDVTSLNIGQSLHVSDIKLPEGLKAVEDEKMTVVLVAAPVAEEEEKTAEEVEAELAESFEEKAGEEGEEGGPAEGSEKPEGKPEGKKEG